MKKTSLYIDPKVDRALARRAVSEGITKAELVRRALAHAAGTPRRPSGRGVFDGPASLATEVDRHLSESGFGER